MEESNFRSAAAAFGPAAAISTRVGQWPNRCKICAPAISSGAVCASDAAGLASYVHVTTLLDLVKKGPIYTTVHFV